MNAQMIATIMNITTFGKQKLKKYVVQEALTSMIEGLAYIACLNL